MNLRRRRTPACRRILVGVVLAALGASLMGCASTALKPIAAEAPGKLWEAGEQIGILTQRNELLRSLRALARVEYNGPDGKHNFQEAIVVQRPDRLRLETLTFLGAILIVTVNTNEIVGYHPREAVMLRGESSKENLLRYTQIALELEELTGLLMGVPPVDIRTPWVQQENTLIFSLNGKKKDEVAFQSQLAVPTRWQRFDAMGNAELTASFGDFTQTAAGFFPLRLSLEAPRQNKKLEIRMEEPELNGPIAAELFTQQKPATVKEYRIEAIGG